MVQVRVMGDDFQRVCQVMELMLPLLQSCPDLVVGDTTQLSHRTGGGRFAFDVSPVWGAGVDGGSAAGGPATEWARAERTDRPRSSARRRPGVDGGRRALPPGGSR